MKKIILLITLLQFSGASFSQVTETPPAVETNYLKKAKNRQSAAWILLGGGGLMMAVGTIIYPEDYDWLFGTTPEKESEANIASALVLVGAVSVAASIPFFISAANNRSKARKELALGFKMEKVPVVQQQSIARSAYPALSLKIKL